MATFDVMQYAQAGARARLADLLAEADRIRRAFPGIERDGDRAAPRKARQQQGSPNRPGRRRTMTAAERRAVSARMKAYWAARREGNASPPSSLTSASGATPKSAVKSTAGRGAERSIDSLALAVIRLVDAGRKVYRVSFTQRDYDFCQGPLRIPQWRPRRHPLAGRNGSRQAPIRSAGTLPYARDVPCLQRCHTAAGHRALR